MLRNWSNVKKLVRKFNRAASDVYCLPGMRIEIAKLRQSNEHMQMYISVAKKGNLIQWNLSVTTTSLIKSITCDLFSNVF